MMVRHPFRLICLLSSLAASALPVLSGQELDTQLRETCEDIMIEAFVEKRAAEPDSTLPFYWLQDVSIDRCRDLLLQELNNEVPEISLQAAQSLLKKTIDTAVRDAVHDAIEDIDASTPFLKVEIAAIRAELGDSDATAILKSWAALDFTDTGEFICPMMCVPATDQPGRCPECSMERVLAQFEPTREHYSAQCQALKRLQERGAQEHVVESARRMLTGDAPASDRLYALYVWSKVDPENACPHLELWLQEERWKHVALHYAIDAMPDKVQPLLEEWAKSTSPNDRFAGIEGLVKAGQTGYLVQMREVIDGIRTPLPADQTELWYSLRILATSGDEDDLPRMKRLLEFDELKFTAATFTLKLLNRHVGGSIGPAQD